MIHSRQIEAFRAIMLAGTSVGAARRLNVTQPAISRLIMDLEAEIGFRLFNRTKGRLEPTTEAVRFFKAVEENFLGLERLMQAAKSISSDAPEGLTIACLPALSTSLLPAALKQFFRFSPQVPVTIDACNNAEMLVRLQDMHVDVGLSIAFPAIAGIETEKILSMPARCAMPSDHRLAAKASILPSDLDGENVIGWLPFRSGAYETEQALLSQPDIRPRYVIRTHVSHTRYAMVAAGFGVSIVEPFAAKLWATHGVVTRPFDSSLMHEFLLTYPSGRMRSRRVHDFRDAVLAAVREYDFGFDD